MHFKNRPSPGWLRSSGWAAQICFKSMKRKYNPAMSITSRSGSNCTSMRIFSDSIVQDVSPTSIIWRCSRCGLLEGDACLIKRKNGSATFEHPLRSSFERSNFDMACNRFWHVISVKDKSKTRSFGKLNSSKVNLLDDINNCDLVSSSKARSTGNFWKIICRNFKSWQFWSVSFSSFQLSNSRTTAVQFLQTLKHAIRSDWPRNEKMRKITSFGSDSTVVFILILYERNSEEFAIGIWPTRRLLRITVVENGKKITQRNNYFCYFAHKQLFFLKTIYWLVNKTHTVIFILSNGIFLIRMPALTNLAIKCLFGPVMWTFLAKSNQTISYILNWKGLNSLENDHCNTKP